MYGKDFDQSTDTWDLASTGAYMRLLNHQWDKGFVPDDQRKVGAVLRVGAAQAKRYRWIVDDKFPVDVDGLRRNPRMAEIRREREAYLAGQSKKGKAGADARWHGPGDSSGYSSGHNRGIDQGNGREGGRGNGSPSSSPSSSLPPAPPPPPNQEGARADKGLGVYQTADMAEAAFHAFLRHYPPEGIPSVHAAQHAWAEVLPYLPPLCELTAALDRHKRSDQWQRGKYHSVVRWLRERMWTGKLGEAAESTRYRPFED